MAASKVFTKLAGFQPTGARCFSVGRQDMVTLKDIRLRLRSVMNIQKITKSMKMVSAAKYSRAERELKPARVYGGGNKALLEKTEITGDDSKPNHLYVAIASDRGLCGGIHSGIAKGLKAQIAAKTAGVTTNLVLCGDKLKAILGKTHGDHILLTMSEMGKKPAFFDEAAFIAQAVLDTGYEFNFGQLYYNKFKSVISYEPVGDPIVSLDTLATADQIGEYDDVDEEILRCYHEFSLASSIFYGLKEQACSEQSSRMTAMDNASKNAGEMIDKLTLTYNRRRQAVITTELIEIISGSVALESKD
jgi:F-type H+-transporting ATPase subunit gamma